AILRQSQMFIREMMIFINTILIVLLTIFIEQFVTHLYYKIPILIDIVIMMHVYITIYVVFLSFLKY
ncbi:anti-sigma factor, partial [Bacillus cereus]|nr:anti-sigma factor [Bacillus cereus]